MSFFFSAGEAEGCGGAKDPPSLCSLFFKEAEAEGATRPSGSEAAAAADVLMEHNDIYCHFMPLSRLVRHYPAWHFPRLICRRKVTSWLVCGRRRRRRCSLCSLCSIRSVRSPGLENAQLVSDSAAFLPVALSSSRNQCLRPLFAW